MNLWRRFPTPFNQLVPKDVQILQSGDVLTRRQHSASTVKVWYLGWSCFKQNLKIKQYQKLKFDMNTKGITWDCTTWECSSQLLYNPGHISLGPPAPFQCWFQLLIVFWVVFWVTVNIERGAGDKCFECEWEVHRESLYTTLGKGGPSILAGIVWGYFLDFLICK